VTKKIELRVGAVVMLLKNIDGSLVNGTLGRVDGWASKEEYPEECPMVTSQLAEDPQRRFACAPMPFTIEEQQKQIATRLQEILVVSIQVKS